MEYITGPRSHALELMVEGYRKHVKTHPEGHKVLEDPF